jgi:hypothetical protein
MLQTTNQSHNGNPNKPIHHSFIQKWVDSSHLPMWIYHPTEIVSDLHLGLSPIIT